MSFKFIDKSNAYLPSAPVHTEHGRSFYFFNFLCGVQNKM